MNKSTVILGALQKIGISFDLDDYENDTNYKASELALERVYENLLSDKNLLFNVKTLFPVRSERTEALNNLYEYKKPLDFRGYTWSNYQVWEKGNKLYCKKATGLQIDYLQAWDFADLPMDYLEYITARLALEIATPLNKTKNLDLIGNIVQIEYQKLEVGEGYGPVSNIDREEVLPW